MKRLSARQFDVLRRLAAAEQPLVQRPPHGLWCVADSAADAATPRARTDGEFYVNLQTAIALVRMLLLKVVSHGLGLSDQGRAAIISMEDFTRALASRKDDRLRRAAMMWLLRVNGHTFREIGALMGPISGGRTAQIVHGYERILRQRAYAGRKIETFERRLAAAGAIPALPPVGSWGPHPMNVPFSALDLPDDDDDD